MKIPFNTLQALARAMVIGLLVMPLIRTPASGAETTPEFFASLQDRLIRDGFNAEDIHGIYAQPGVGFEIQGVALFFRHSESRLDYDQFLKSRRIQMARDYMIVHSGAFASAEDQYGVPRQIITAIMLVETQLGMLVGNQTVFNILSTMAALDDPAVREIFWKELPREGRLTRKAFQKKADRKSSWAYNELKALLQYVQAEKMDPVAIRGSYAGAMGYCQFMPSNALQLGVDGNGDARIDLFDHTDAIASIGNYLKHHGWKPGLTRQQQFQVILKYNYSKPYASTILKIADQLKG
jgi:membrane-bound lytic murein transglycosylase B